MITRYRPKDHQDWLRCRTEGIGGSEVGFLLADKDFFLTHPYARTPYQIWQDKVSDRERVMQGVPLEEETNEVMQDGHDLEYAVAMKFERKTGLSVIKSSAEEFIFRNDVRPYTYASPDRLYWIDADGVKSGKNAHANKGYLECKVTTMDIDEDNPPIYWQFQLQWVMGVAGLKEGYLAWYNKRAYSDMLRCKRYEFDEKMFAAVLTILDPFWDCVVDGMAPPPVIGDDVKRAWPNPDKDSTVEADSHMLGIYHRLKELKAQQKSTDEEIRRCEGDMKLYMGESAVLSYEGSTLATFRGGGGEKPTRRFLLK